MTRKRVRLGKWTEVVVSDLGGLVFSQDVTVNGKDEKIFLILTQNEAKKLKKVM